MIGRFTGAALSAVLTAGALAVPAAANPGVEATPHVVTAEQASRKILVFDPGVTSWAGTAATK